MLSVIAKELLSNSYNSHHKRKLGVLIIVEDFFNCHLPVLPAKNKAHNNFSLKSAF